MIFSSLIFLYIFLPITLVMYYFSPKCLRNALMLFISLIFYGWGEPIYIILMTASILIGYFGGRLIDKFKENDDMRKCIFITVILINITFLLFFKYYGFMIDNINMVFGTNLKIKELALPLGISFYTFQIISYVIDVYKKEVDCQKNIINFGAYVSMFPQLVAGPIVQYSTIEKQLNERKEDIDKFTCGVERFLLGLGKKVIIANNLGAVWTTVKSLNDVNASVLTYWIGIVFFTLQIYFDFSGYSDMAIGLGKMFGFDFLENFNYPYVSKSVTEFWRRWHISLGSWFRDYIYIPLGGNRHGLTIQIRNLFAVWFITGFWHGASWNFIIWGLYFGVIIFIEKIVLIKYLKMMNRIISNLYTMIIVIIGWVFFDSNTVKESISYIGKMFGFSQNTFIDDYSISLLYTNRFILIMGIICATPLFKMSLDFIKRYNFGKIILVSIYIGILIISTCFLVGESYNPFLYFRF